VFKATVSKMETKIRDIILNSEISIVSRYYPENSKARGKNTARKKVA